MLKGALIGCGFFAINQLNAWRDIADGDGAARIVALCDSDPARLAEVAQMFGVERTYQDAAELFAAEKLDFVDICTTIASHRPLVEMAAIHGVPVICQKPLAPTLEDARAMVAACDRAGIALMVHENFRWQSPLMAVKDMLASGRIGRPFWARLSFRSGYDVYAGQPYLAKGERFIVEDLGVHVLDVARFLFGDVARMTARLQRVNPDIAGEDVATMLLDHQSGVTSVVDCSYASKLAEELFPQTLVEIDADAGSLRLQPGYRLIVTGKGGESEVIDLSPPLLSWASRPWHNVQESVLLIQKHWVDCLRQGKTPATSGHDNLKTLALVESAYLSASGGTAIEPGSLL